MDFKTIVMTVAIILLIFVLILVGISLFNAKSDVAFPPVVADCPDYWLDLSEGDSSQCKNIKNLGKESCYKIMNFSQAPFTGDVGLCEKAKWAKSCDLTWDGVTNNVNACSKK